jgi:hypothetical protein
MPCVVTDCLQYLSRFIHNQINRFLFVGVCHSVSLHERMLPGSSGTCE